MRGGKNKKSIEDHIANGTYRPCRHGAKPVDTDKKKLELMKETLYKTFLNYKDNLSTLDMEKSPEQVKLMTDMMINITKTFYQIVKTPVIDEKEKEAGKTDSDGFKTL